MYVDAVLGLSMTPTSFGLVLVGGQDADGATMDREAFDVEHGPVHTSEQATAAVLRTEAIAATRGVRLHSIGLTWSDDAGDQASQLMQSLSESGFDNVVAIRLPEATEALARGMADVIGYETTAVCVVEPETMITLIVHTDSGAVQTAFNHAIDSEDGLIRWLSTVFTRADWQPQALVIVGSAGGFDDEFLRDLEDALSVPVFSPAESELALARGAALASTAPADPPFDAFAVTADPDVRRRGVERRRTPQPFRRPSTQAGALTMLVAGVLTFVVSVSVAVSLEMSPRERSGPVTPAGVVEAPRAPAAPEVLPADPPAAPVMPPPAAPEPVEEAPIVETPPADVPAEAPAPDVPADEMPPAAIDPDPAAAPAVAPAYTAPQPTRKPTLRSRIMDKLRGDDGAADQSDPLPPG